MSQASPVNDFPFASDKHFVGRLQSKYVGIAFLKKFSMYLFIHLYQYGFAASWVTLLVIFCYSHFHVSFSLASGGSFELASVFFGHVSIILFRESSLLYVCERGGEGQRERESY